MAYRFKRKESVSGGVARIIDEQVTNAAENLTGANPDINEGVHEARKSFKKARSVLRLARSGLGERLYREENSWFRDAKNSLSSVRDAEAMIETYDALGERFAVVKECPSLLSVREGLTARRDRIAEQDQDLDRRAEELAAKLKGRAEDAERLNLEKEGFAAIGPGLDRAYRRGRKAMKEAYKSPSDEQFHEWRKRVKDYWYQSRLMRNACPEALNPQIADLKQLSDVLGDDHDLAVFGQVLQNHDGALEGDTSSLVYLAQGRQEELRAEARLLGKRIYAKNPKSAVKALAAHWRDWKTR